MRIVQISDTHVSRQHTHFAANCAGVARWLSANKPELIVHTGDLCMDGSGASEDLDFAASWDGLQVAPTLVVPGNHDVGDLASINPDQPVNDARLAAWRGSIGPDRWLSDRSGWRLIGLNAMLCGTGHSEEEAQFDWAREALDTNLPVAVFLHKPLFIDEPNEGARGYWTVTPAPRARLMALFAQAKVRLVASGHLHIYRQQRLGDINYVWGPAASFVVGASQEDLGGERKLGVMVHEFGASDVTSTFVRPDGLEDLQIEPVQHIIYPRPTVSGQTRS